MVDHRYQVQYAKNSNATCKNTRCKKEIEKGELRLGKEVANPKGDESDTHWYHLLCMFDSLRRARKATKKIGGEDDLKGFDSLEAEDQKKVLGLISESKLPPRKRKELLSPARKRKSRSKSPGTSSDSDEDVKPKKSSKKSAQKKKKKPASSTSSSSDSESEDDKRRKKPKKEDPSSSSESEEDIPIKKRRGRPPKSLQAKASPIKEKKVEKKKVIEKKVSESSSSSDSSDESSDSAAKEKKHGFSNRRKKSDPSKLFDEMIFCMSGDLVVDTKTIKDHGGSISSSVGKEVDFVLSNEDDVKKGSSKVKKAKKMKIAVLSEAFIQKSIDNGRQLRPEDFKLV